MSEIYKSSLTAITPDLLIMDSLIMKDEHLDTNPEKKSDKFIKSSVENLVSSPIDFEDLSDIESECDVSVCDDFTNFSNTLFDADEIFSSSNDESFSNEDILKEIYSNPLFDKEIIFIKIYPHHFNVESDLIESLLNQDSSIISSPKIDSLLEEFSGEFAHINLILPRIDEAGCDPKEEIRLVKKFDSVMEEIDIFLALDDSMPPGIKNDDYDSEGDIFFLEEFLSNDSPSLPKNESFHFDIPSSPRPPVKPPDDGIYFKPVTRLLTTKVKMVISSSSSKNEVFDDSFYSTACKKNTKDLNTKITKLNEEVSNRKTMLYHYKLGLSQVEARLVEFKKQEIKFCEKIRGLEFNVESKNNRIERLTNELEQIKKEKESLETKLTGFKSATKDLDTLLQSQRSDKNKEGLGYSVVPPPPAHVYSPLMKDISWIGLPEFADDTITDYSRPSPSIESNFSDLQNSNSFVSENEESSESIMSKSMIKFVKAADCADVKTNNVEAARKPPMKYAEMYR
nr:hypothetical protein [Tanacetum cinerariifolium]